jgi:excinuclease ABC subunit C
MQEIVERYFRRGREDQRPLPDLVLIDGGKGQLAAAAQAMERAGVADLPLASLAKREELIFTLDAVEPLRLSRREPGLRLLQQVRDEAHRFGLSYHRKRRSRRTLRSGLLDIRGVGPARERALIKAFGSVRGVKAASVDEVAEVAGIGSALADKIVRHLANGDGEGD